MILSLITNDLAHIALAQSVGIQRILVDLEIESKRQRQAGRRLFLSDHRLEDVARIRHAYPTVSLTVRINSMHPGSALEIAQLAPLRPDRVMLPYISSLAEIDRFLQLLPTPIEPILLLENRFSLQILPKLIDNYPIREVFIGLNDLSIDLGHPNLVLTILHENFRRSVRLLQDSSLTWGFGGIGSFADRRLPIAPERFFDFQLCLGSTSGWLSRSFRRLFDQSDPEPAVAAAMSQMRELMAANAGRDGQTRQQCAAHFQQQLAPLTSLVMY